MLGIFPGLLDGITEFVGLTLPVNLLFLLSIVLLMSVCLHLTLEVSRLSEKTRILAEEVAILRALHEQPGGAPAHRTPQEPDQDPQDPTSGAEHDDC